MKMYLGGITVMNREVPFMEEEFIDNYESNAASIRYPIHH